ncbi:MAG: metallophosphoesterase family protein [Candidatus Cloacimonetes bacterium]|nr:metallophosphoesterase family protein [Candidatus Cloacimonadota bacterium]MBS3766749.1 metallophosphoesterase family protein [Candidatus Cloacimonadota bacterium]
MNILIISDTHGNMNLLSSVLEANIDCDTVIHLGDNYGDLANFKNLLEEKTVYKVPGIYHPDYLNGKLAPDKLIEIDNKKILQVHSKNDICKEADLYLFGHTHDWEISNSKKGIFLNPGHLREKTEKGRTASYALMEITHDKFHIRLLDFKHNKFLEATI